MKITNLLDCCAKFSLVKRNFIGDELIESVDRFLLLDVYPFVASFQGVQKVQSTNKADLEKKTYTSDDRLTCD